MNLTVVGAIFRRNFAAYFSNPTGYVFICVFVLLSSLAAFWPSDFFINNLANLDQLNRYLPFILLVFIPAITMGIWAEERKQGTDELLLTIPATDLDVVVGKFLAGVSIYSVALLFSATCNFLVLFFLGRPDFGLFVSTYFGYWLMGSTMLSIGMVGSFLTGNTTVSFILGALFNAPLVFAQYADLILPPAASAVELDGVRGKGKALGFIWNLVAPAVNKISPEGLDRSGQWLGLSEQFRDFGRGVISLPSVAYFFCVTVVALYVSMILIGRRHWAGGRSAGGLAWHYFIRVVSVLIIVGSIVMLCDRTGARADITEEAISSLSRETRTLITQLQPKHGVTIDAYISPEVPEAYVQSRLNLLSALREFQALGGSKILVHIHDTPPLSAAADQAEKLYGITSREVFTRNRGATTREEIYLGVAVKSGLEKVVVPFFDFGTPVEYEIARSIATVCNEKRKTVGVLQTDARMFGGFDPGTMSQTQDSMLIEELRKQFEVKQVNPAQPITEKFDVLLAVQPSSLGIQEMENFIASVKSGQPTAIFEDPFPFPFVNPGVVGTAAPKQPPGGMQGMMGGQQAPPKGNIDPLWNLLGVKFEGTRVIWQNYNPYPRFPFDPEFVFVNSACSDAAVFNKDDESSKHLEQLLFLYPGSIVSQNASSLRFKPLVTTGGNTGTVTTQEVWTPSFFGGGGPNRSPRRIPSENTHYILAGHIQGTIKADQLMADGQVNDAADIAKALAAAAPPTGDVNIDVILVADIDCLAPDFFGLRSQAGNPDRADFNLVLDNVTFILNVLDELSGDARFIPIRSRRPKHRTLERVEQVTEESRKAAAEGVEKLKSDLEKSKKETRDQFEAEIKKLQERKDIDPLQLIRQLEMKREHDQRKQQVRDQASQKQFDRDRKNIERQLSLELESVHRKYKFWAVMLPPIPPLLVGLGVFFNRRAREREGVARSRLR